ncbi:Nucleic-acid-binding protein from transposon X-element [Eumeta japonica]|uniref:Nucleic-acid-binding protein from transposon X-element n=1 Tax=Eumeta variegata TaxID=151549 RepID=A0A4C1SXE9_EUMVA|nr:Nucleic-acid-binding protein from transposon X-element [Eumeta japonica]
MAGAAPGTVTAGGTASSSSKTLPLGELKILFFKFLERLGYALPSEADSVLGLRSSDSTNKNVNEDSRGQSPCPSLGSSGKRSSSALSSDEGLDNSDSTIKGSDDEEFQIIKRKNKRVARRLRKSSNSSQSNDSAMEIEQVKVKSTNHSDSSITSKTVTAAKTVASNKEATVSGANTLKTANVTGSKPSPPPKCHRCQLYGYAATNCHVPPRCVKCLDSHWTKECSRTRESGGKPVCCNCGSDHTANYGGCAVAPKRKPRNNINKNIRKVQQTSRPLNVSQFPALNSENKQTARTTNTVSSKPTGSKNFHPANPPKENQWKNPLP